MSTTCDLLGYNDGQLCGRHLEDLLPEDDWENIQWVDETAAAAISGIVLQRAVIAP
jgi:hypothetical protein